MQPGPIYFKTLQECGIFAVMCKAISQQVNYLIDEAVDVGMGANTTISCMHHYFKNHGLGETDVHLHVGTETKYLDTAYVRLPILLVIGCSGLPGL